MILVTTFTRLNAQAVAGKVVDDKGIAIPYVSVQMLNPADSSFMDGTVSAEDGSFSVANVQRLPIL